MKLKAKDTLHVSSVKADNLLPGEEFEVSDDMGRQLLDRGVASEVKAAKEKAEPAPQNKAEAPPANKSAAKRKGK